MEIKINLRTACWAAFLGLSTPLWGQSNLSQVIPYSFPGVMTDTMRVYENGPSFFRPLTHTGLYFTPQYSLPNPRVGFGIQNLYVSPKKWMLQTHIEFHGSISANRAFDGTWGTYPLGLEAIKQMAGFAGSAVYSSIRKQKLHSNKVTALVASNSKGNTTTSYYAWYELANTRYHYWRVGVTQNQNTNGHYTWDETENNLLGYRYQALRVGLGLGWADGVSYKARSLDTKRTSHVDLLTVYADVLLPVARQNIFTGMLNPTDAESVRYLPGFELGTTYNNSRKGTRQRNSYRQFVVGMHPVQYRNRFTFYTGLRLNMFSTSYYKRNKG